MSDAPKGSAFVRDKYLDGLQQIREELRSYWLNHAFLLGYQWIWWNHDTSRLDVISHEADRIQPTMNLMRANTRTIMAKATQRPLQFENNPTQYDDATIRAARLGESIIRDTASPAGHDWERKRAKLSIAMWKGGSAAISVDWDADNGDTVETVLPIGDFVVEPGALEAETARWWIRKQALPPAEVQAIYEMESEPPADSTTGLDPYMHKIVGDHLGSGDKAVPRTHVFTYYERPNPLCPEGKFLVEIDGQIIERGTWPFPWSDRLNIAVAIETVVENQWQGATVLDDVRPIQVAFNAVWANYLEHLRDASTARLAVPSSSADLIRELTDTPGEILEYADGSAPPAYIDPAQITTWLRELAPQLKSLIDDLMGLHDVSRGMAPGSVESGLGIQILVEQDESPVGHMIGEQQRVFTRVAQMNLMLREAEQKEKQETTVVDGRTPVRTDFKGKELHGQTGITVPLDALVPRSHAALQALADKAMEMGLITNVIQYAKVADLPNQEDLIAAAAPDAAKARRENAMFEMGEVILPATFDDHELHIEMHNEFRKTVRYEQMADEDREVVDDHVQAHETVAAQAAAKAQMQQMQSPALAAAPDADGTAIDPALLEAGVPAEPEAELPQPPPEDPGEPIDPSAMTADIMASLEAIGE